MKKLFSLLGITALCSLFLVGCKKKTEKKNDDPKYAIYLKALDAGYDGTYDEWLNSIKGDEVELRVDNGYVQMKYKKASEWTNLISLESLKGKDGSNGSDGLSIKSELQVSNGFIQWKNDSDTEWSNLISLEDLTGKDGSKVVFNVNEGFINYKYEDSTEWVELISLDTLTGSNGENGKEVTMSVDENYIVWKYVGDTSWNNLIDLDTLKGKNGDKGDKTVMQVTDDYIQWKYETDTSWNNLIALDLLKGDNGKEVEFRTNDGYVQWKYTTDSEWINLYRYEEDDVTYRVSLYIPYQYSDIELPITIDDWQTQTVHAFSKATLPQGITEYLSNLSDYEFNGWYYQGEKWNFSGCVVTEDMALEARLTKKTKKISFTLDNQTDYAILSNAEFDGSYYNCNEDSYVTFAAINVPNWINVHWMALTKDDYYEEIGYGASIYFTANDRIRCVLVEIEYLTYTVTFDVEGDTTLIDSQSINVNGKVEKPANPSKDYYEFDGWYYNDEKWNFNGCVVTEDMTLEARFVLKEYHIYVNNPNHVLLLSNIKYMGDYYTCSYFDYVYLAGYNLDNYHTIHWTLSYEINGEIEEYDSYGNEFEVFDISRDIFITVEKVVKYERVDNFIYFGYYPQTLVDDTSITDDLDSTALLPSTNDKWISYGYGHLDEYDNPSIKMWYIDLDTNSDGRYDYRGVYFISFRNEYQVTNGYEVGNVYWFKYEPIKWGILEENNEKALLISYLAIDSQPYGCNDSVDESYFYNLSYIRNWLNDEFYNTAFSDAEKQFILITEVDNSAKTTGYEPNMYECDNTYDSIFLLSSEEYSTTYHDSIFNGDILYSVRKQGTDYSSCQGLDNDTIYMRLRSVWSEELGGALVAFYGPTESVRNMMPSSYTHIGIYPAMWIEL